MNIDRLLKAIKRTKEATDEIVEDAIMQIREGSETGYTYIGTIAKLNDAVSDLEIAMMDEEK